MYRYHNSRLFSNGSIQQIFETNYNSITVTIFSESDNYILNVNEEGYIDHIESRNQIICPIIHFEQVFADSYEADVPADYFPSTYNVYRGKAYRKEIIQYFIPVTGDINLLNYKPAATIFIGGSGGNFLIQGNELLVEFINFNNDAEDIKQKYDREVSGIHDNYEALMRNIEVYRNSLRSF